MYKTRFKRWGLWKNTKAADVAEVLRQTGETLTTSTTTTTTTTSTTTTVTTSTASTSPGQQQQHTPPPLPSASTTAQAQVFLVNGKHVDAHRVERYIRNRCRQYRLRPDALSASLIKRLSSTTTSKPTTSLLPLGLSLQNSALLTEESTYHVVSNYFDGSLASGRWQFAQDSDCDLCTEGGVEMSILVSEFHERFKLAAPLLADPVKHGSSGVKMARICFAELPHLLGGTPEYGAEEPVLLCLVLIVLQYIRKQGETLRWMEVQLARYIADLAASLPGGRPAKQVWALLRDSVMNRTLDDRLSLQINKVATEVCRRRLGPHHGKTIELLVLGTCNFDTDIAAHERMFIELREGLDALGTFDERHAGVRMNQATFYNMHGLFDKGRAVVRECVEDPWVLAQCARYRGLRYKLYWELGRSTEATGEMEEAEQAYRDSIRVAKMEAEENIGGTAEIMDGLVNLENCLRKMGKVAEAEEAVREREMWVKKGLEKVGEVEEPGF
ncbi:hypothetical protein B0T19DRAFT_196439 [Cercophora scortea]|uniref:Clr5 domain-containing protein n=1 Tax=Cercophora scortea TaxID=314031 RepID=A0AAE0IPB9_9PEZI|nr:hypothetical protein B0T19DRAFT_196439 [Cercophora scortea]